MIYDMFVHFGLTTEAILMEHGRKKQLQLCRTKYWTVGCATGAACMLAACDAQTLQ